MSMNLQTLQNDINTEISSTVKQINAYAEQLASLTKQINSLEVYGGQANDLRDQRARILDELSALADVEVTEKVPETGSGLHQYIVALGGNILVDTYSYKTISVETSATKDNQCDIQGLYGLKWSDGQTFNIRSTILGGKLQALFEIRDGNNGENFNAKLTDNGNGTCVGKDAKGKSTITLSENLDATSTTNIEKAYKKGDSASIGDSVDFRGIPYYMSQLNEFIRTFSANVNQLQNAGYDMNNDHGVDLFVGLDSKTNKQMDMIELIRNTKDGYYYLNGSKVFSFSGNIDDSADPTKITAGADKNDATLIDYLKNNEYTIKKDSEEVVSKNGIKGKIYTLVNKDGDDTETIFIPDDAKNIFSFSSSSTEDANGDVHSSYYGITAARFQANKNVVKDGRLMAAAKYPQEKTGLSESGNLDRLVALQNDQNIFKQGTPTAFLQIMTATIGVDSSKVVAAATNSENIQKSIENRRLSVMGVDEDEEAQNLVITQNLLNAQYRVISVMNEVLDKLINQTGV